MADRRFSATHLPGFSTTAILVFVALYVPIFTLVVYSFNVDKTMGAWGGFSLNWYAKAWANEQVKDATIRSLVIAGFAAVISTSTRNSGRVKPETTISVETGLGSSV